MARTTVDIDDAALVAARAALGTQGLNATINSALREVARRHALADFDVLRDIDGTPDELHSGRTTRGGVFGIVEATWASRIPLIRDQLHLSDVGLSIALAGPAIGLLVAARAAPAFVNRLGNARATRAAVLTGAACLVLPAFAWNLASLTVGLAIWGACLGTLEITMNARGSALEQTQDRSLLSGLHAGYSFAVLAFAPVGALAARLNIRPLLHFAVIAGGCMVAALLFGPSSGDGLIAPPRPAQSESAPPALKAHPTLIGLAFIGFSALVAEGSVANWGGVFLRQTDQASLALAPFGLTAFSAGMVVGRLSGDTLIMRRGHYSMVWHAAALAAGGMTLAVSTGSITVAIAGYAALGLGLSVLIPIVFALSAITPGVPPVWALSRMTTATYVGLFVRPPVIGMLSAAISLRGALLCVAVLLLGVALIGRMLSRR